MKTTSRVLVLKKRWKQKWDTQFNFTYIKRSLTLFKTLQEIVLIDRMCGHVDNILCILQ